MMEVEEVQVKMEDEAKAGGNTSEKVLVDKELLKVLFSILSNPSGEPNKRTNLFYMVDHLHKIRYFECAEGGNYIGWYTFDYADDLERVKNNGFLCPELSNLSFEEIKKLGETSVPGIYFKGKKVWDL